MAAVGRLDQNSLNIVTNFPSSLFIDTAAGGYYTRDTRPTSEKFSLRVSGLRFLQRLNSLRQSARRREKPGKPVSPETSDHPDSDRVFFRGFSGVSAQPRAPPRRRKANLLKPKLSRSRSLTYSDILKPRSGPGLGRIEELYPDIPRTPIYAAVDLSKKRRRDLPDLVTLPPDGVGEEGDIVTPNSDKEITDDDPTKEITTEEETNKMVKSHSASNSPSWEVQLDNGPSQTHKKKKHKKKKEKREEYYEENVSGHMRPGEHRRNRKGKTPNIK